MVRQRELKDWTIGSRQRIAALILSVAKAVMLMSMATPVAQAQTYRVVYDFTGGQDEGCPYSGLILDKLGNLYGTTAGGCVGRFGTVFRLQHIGQTWSLATLFSFDNANGFSPAARTSGL